MTSVTATTRSGNQDVDGLLADFRWNPASGVLRYGFPATSDAWTGYDPDGEPYNNYRALSAAQQNLVAQILGGVSGFTTALTFSGSGSADTADLRFGMTDGTESAHAYTPYFDEPAGKLDPMRLELRSVLAVAGLFNIFFFVYPGPLVSVATAAAKSLF